MNEIQERERKSDGGSEADYHEVRKLRNILTHSL